MGHTTWAGVEVPGAYADQLVELVERLGVAPGELLGDLPLTAALLKDPNTKVALPVYRALVRRAHELTGEDGLGFYMGLKMRVSTHGFLGFAAMTAQDVRGAIDVGVRFAATRSEVIALRFREEGDEAMVELVELMPLDDIREFTVASLMVGMAHIGEAITGAPIHGRAHASFSEPAAFHRFRHLLPGDVRFDQAENCLIFPRAALDRPLIMADPVAQELAKQQCERELLALERSRGMRARVERLLPSDAGGYRTLEEVAEALHVSPRTLKRQLAGEGTTFSEVLDGVRQRRAMVLLQEAERSVEQIAALLGYSDTANFTRAFKRWTGATPAAFRARARRAPG